MTTLDLAALRKKIEKDEMVHQTIAIMLFEMVESANAENYKLRQKLDHAEECCANPTLEIGELSIGLHEDHPDDVYLMCNGEGGMYNKAPFIKLVKDYLLGDL